MFFVDIKFVLGLIIGIIVTWLVTHIYYKKAFRDQKLLYDKISRNLRKWILADTRTHLSVKDLNSLLEEKTIDPNSDYPFPYKVCPKCGSNNIIRYKDIQGEPDYCDGEMTYSPIYFNAISCEDCGWTLSEAG